MKVRGRFDPRTPMVELAPGLRMPERGSAKAWDLSELPGLELEMQVELIAAQYRCRELRVWQTETGSEVTGEALRSVPVATIVREGVLSMARGVLTLSGQGGPPDDVIGVGPTPEALAWVARIYRLAYAVGDAPRQAVESAFGVPASTAGRWVARARTDGYLPPAGGPGMAGGRDRSGEHPEAR